MDLILPFLTDSSVTVGKGIDYLKFHFSSFPITITALEHRLLATKPVEFFLYIFIATSIISYFIHQLITWLFGPSSYRDAAIYINSFTVFTDFRPEWNLTLQEWKQRQLDVFQSDPAAVKFTHRMIDNAGITPDKQHIAPGPAVDPPDLSIASSRFEAEVIMFSCVDKIMSENNLAPKDVDILIVNCSLFNPTPSLCAMLINKFKFREDIITYNLSGMGCSASALAVQLASHNLRLSAKKHPIAIVVSLEVLTSHMYQGTQPEFLLSNALFRMNGSAVLLSRDSGAVHGRPAPLWRIDHLERVHLGASDKAYNAIHLDDDQDNNLGVRLSRDLMKEAARGVELNLTTLAPKILPYHELVRTGLRMALRALSTSLFPPKKVSSTSRSSSLPSQPTDTKTQNHKDDKTVAKTTETAATAAADQDTSTSRPAPIIPNFKTAVDYWLIHAGGKAIITGIRDALNLTEEDVKPSRDVMYKYGNTSSASIWYELDEVEKASKVKNGQHALAIAIGSGIKVQTLYLTSVNRAK